MHYLEFVRPIEDILKKEKKAFFVKGYKEVQQKDLEKAERVIICGTSLADNDFGLSENMRFFKWIDNFDKPLFGICGGMQVIGKAFGTKIKKLTEIGFFKENFYRNFLGLFKEQEVYHLHNYYADFSNNDFEIYAGGNISQAVKHHDKPIYGVLFHPEVRQKSLIVDFLKI